MSEETRQWQEMVRVAYHQMPVDRAGSKGGGSAVVLDAEKIDVGKFRFGMDRVDLEEGSTVEPKQMGLGGQ